MTCTIEGALASLSRQLHARSGIIGCHIGRKITRGCIVAPSSLVVLVERKHEPAPADRIPPEWEGYPTDVRQPRFTLARDRLAGRAASCGDADGCLGEDFRFLLWDRVHAQAALARPDGEVATAVDGDLFVVSDPACRLIVEVGDQSAIDCLGAYRLFRESFGDDYDFLAFFVDEASGFRPRSGPSDSFGNAASLVFTDVDGINLPHWDQRAKWRSERLRALMLLSTFNLRTMLHEQAHLWCAYARTSPDPAEDLLHQDFHAETDELQKSLHWGRWVNNHASSMDYDHTYWRPSASGGTYQIEWLGDAFGGALDVQEAFGYWALDQYLMGFLPPEAVPDTDVVWDPEPPIDDSRRPGEPGFNYGPYRPRPRKTLSMKDVIETEGPRSPDYLESPRVFRQATIVLTRNPPPRDGHFEWTQTFLGASHTWLRRHVENFRRATDGRAVLDATLVRKDASRTIVQPYPHARFWDCPHLRAAPSGAGAPTAHRMQAPGRGTPAAVFVHCEDSGAAPAPARVRWYLGSHGDLVPATRYYYPEDWHPKARIGSEATLNGTPGRRVASMRWLPSDGIRRFAPGYQPSLLCEILPLDPDPRTLHDALHNEKIAVRSLSVIAPPDDDGGGRPSAFFFEYRFRVGHRLPLGASHCLRIQSLQRNGTIHLFLDPKGRGSMAAVPAPALDLGLAVPLQAGQSLPPEASVQRLDAMPAVPAGPPADTTGFAWISLNGMPLLHMTASDKAEIVIGLEDGGSEVMSIYGIVGLAGSGLFDVVDLGQDGNVLGGVSFRIAP